MESSRTLSLTVDEVETSATDGRLLAVHYEGEKHEVHYVDEGAAAIARGLEAALPGVEARIIETDQAERFSIVAVSSDVSRPRYFLYDRQAQTLRLLFSAYPQLDGVVFAPMEPIEYEARDGLRISGYLTKPIDGDGPHPTIVLPHGGPWAWDTWGWNAKVQYLVSLGFAVLQPNFRGSDGYGAEFKTLGFGERS